MVRVIDRNPDTGVYVFQIDDASEVESLPNVGDKPNETYGKEVCAGSMCLCSKSFDVWALAGDGTGWNKKE